MCATARFKLRCDICIEDVVYAIKDMAEEHHMSVDMVSEGGYIHGTLQPLDENGRGVCWCWASYDDDRYEYYRSHLSGMLDYLTDLGNLEWMPDGFDYKYSGDVSMTALEIPIPEMGDGRVITITSS